MNTNIIFGLVNRVMTSKNGADFVHFVMPAQAPASQNGQSRAEISRSSRYSPLSKPFSNLSCGKRLVMRSSGVAAVHPTESNNSCPHA